jgi:hypothetical protein
MCRHLADQQLVQAYQQERPHITIALFQGSLQQLIEHPVETMKPAQATESQFLHQCTLTRIPITCQLRRQQDTQ